MSQLATQVGPRCQEQEPGLRQPVTPSVTHHTVSRVTRAPMLWDHASTQHVTDITAGTGEVAREEGRERDAAVDWMVFLCCCAAAWRTLLGKPTRHEAGNPPRQGFLDIKYLHK